MLQGNKSAGEIRFELVTLGAMLVVGALLYVALPSNLHSLVIFFPGLILLGSAIYQDLQPGWKAGWLTYVVAILAVAVGITGLINDLFQGPVKGNLWLIISLAMLGVILIFKALYDPSRNLEE